MVRVVVGGSCVIIPEEFPRYKKVSKNRLGRRLISTPDKTYYFHVLSVT
jgi:hypothetical protein